MKRQGKFKMKSFSFRKELYFLLCSLMLMVASSCNQKVNKVTTTNGGGTETPAPGTGTGGGNSSNNVIPIASPVPTVPDTDLSIPNPPPAGDATGSSTTNCGVAGVGPQHFDYFKLPIKGSGNKDTQGGLMWSSLQGLATNQQNYLVTDERLHIRIKAKPDPRSCPLYKNFTSNQWNDYGKLKITISVRSQTSGDDPADPMTDKGTFEQIVFTDVKVGECSPVRRFHNLPISDQALILEVRDVQYDYYCKLGQQAYCPYTWIDMRACWEIELHVSTDYTRDIPQ